MNCVARLLLVLGAIAGCLFLTAASASAHPLGNFTVNRYTGLLISPDGVTVDHVIDLAEIPTAQRGDALDDLTALAQDECTTARQGLKLTASGDVVPLELATSSASTASGQGGLPTSVGA